MRTKLYGIAVSSFSALIFGYLSIRVFFPSIKSGVNLLKGLSGIVPAVVLFLILLAIDRFVVQKMDRATCKAAIVFMIAINAVMQAICILDLRVSPSWDFGAVMAGASDIAAGRPIKNIFYFQEYPFNLNPTVVIGTFKYLLGAYRPAPYGLNILAITSSIAGACLTAWRVFSPTVAVRTAFFCLAATPLYLYAPIVYTDTLSMPFAIWSVYAWSFIRFPGPLSSRMYGLPACAALGLLAGAGYLIKPVAAIGLLAFALDYFMCCRRYGGIRPRVAGGARRLLVSAAPLVSAFAVFVIIIFSFRAYVDYKGFGSRLDRNRSIPYTHWLLMGMNKPIIEGGTSYGYGGFSNEDLKLTRSFKIHKDKEKAEIVKIRQRFEEFGLEGYASFLLKKVEWTWTDGTYYSPVKLGRFPLKLNVLHKFVLPNKGKSNRLFLGFTQLTQGILLFLVFSGALLSIRRGEGSAYRFMLATCLGLMLFLVFWETRSRYLTFMIPVLVLMAAAALDNVFRALGKHWSAGSVR